MCDVKTPHVAIGSSLEYNYVVSIKIHLDGLQCSLRASIEGTRLHAFACSHILVFKFLIRDAMVSSWHCNCARASLFAGLEYGMEQWNGKWYGKVNR